MGTNDTANQNHHNETEARREWDPWSGISGKSRHHYPSSAAEFKLVLRNLAPALRHLEWSAVFQTTLASFCASIAVFLLLSRILDGVWDFNRVWGRAAFVASIVGGSTLISRCLQWAIRRISSSGTEETHES